MTNPTPGTLPNGRPGRLNDQVHAVIVAAIASGSPGKWAARAAGVSDAAYHDWRRRGREAFAAIGINTEQDDYDPDTALDDVPTTERPYAKFLVDTKAAEAKRVVTLVADIRYAQPWQAKAWLLERLHSDDFPRPRLEVSGVDGGPVVIADARTLLMDRLDRLAHPVMIDGHEVPTAPAARPAIEAGSRDDA